MHSYHATMKNKSQRTLIIKVLPGLGAGAALPCCSISFSKSLRRAFSESFSGLSSWPSAEGEAVTSIEGRSPTDLDFRLG